jgi:hypothetical protein
VVSEKLKTRQHFERIYGLQEKKLGKCSRWSYTHRAVNIENYYTTLQFQSAIRPFQSANTRVRAQPVWAVVFKSLGKARQNKTMTRENTQPYYTTSSVISSIYYKILNQADSVVLNYTKSVYRSVSFCIFKTRDWTENTTSCISYYHMVDIVQYHIFIYFAMRRFSPVFTGFHQFSPVFTGFHRFSPVFTGFHRFSAVHWYPFQLAIITTRSRLLVLCL